MRRPWPALGRSATEKNFCLYQSKKSSCNEILLYQVTICVHGINTFLKWSFYELKEKLATSAWVLNVYILYTAVDFLTFSRRSSYLLLFVSLIMRIYWEQDFEKSRWHVVKCHIKPSLFSGHYICYQFNIHKFCVLPTQFIYVFCVDLRTNSDYFPIQHWLTGFCNRDGVCLLRGTSWI